MLPETLKVMKDKCVLLADLSTLMGWEYMVTDTIADFKGYRKWRKAYNKDLESVIFSTKVIDSFDRDMFIKWFDRLPAQARFRVKNRILYSKNNEAIKYPKLQVWYKEWENYKLEKQQEQRVLEEKVRQNEATLEDLNKLKEVKKEAKVTVGATNFNELYKDILSNNIDKLKLESFINKVNLPYNSLVFIDDSGSMSGGPFNFAQFIAAVCLAKNPDDDGRNLLAFFNTDLHMHTYVDVRCAETPNWMMRGKISKINPEPFIDPKKSFYDNFIRIKQFCNGVFQGGGTDIAAIPVALEKGCRNFPDLIDSLKNYPVWTIISDGEWNSLPSPEKSIKLFQDRCKKLLGFTPFIVAIDIEKYGYVSANRFEGVENFIYIPSNPAQIEQFLVNFKDIDTADVYMPLQSIFRSDRYKLVRDNTL